MADDVWGSCPECGDPIKPDLDQCKGCGFPLRPSKKAVPAPAPSAPPPPPTPQESRSKGMTSRRGKRKTRGRPLLQPAEEPPTAMMFAIVGLLVPLFAILALAQSRPGTAARRLAWIGIAVGIGVMILTVSLATHRS